MRKWFCQSESKERVVNILDRIEDSKETRFIAFDSLFVLFSFPFVVRCASGIYSAS